MRRPYDKNDTGVRIDVGSAPAAPALPDASAGADDHPGAPPWLERISPVLSIAGGERGRTEWLDPQRVIYDHELMLLGSGGRYRFEFFPGSRDPLSLDLDGPAFIVIPPGLWHVCRGLVCHGVPRAWLHFDWVAVPRAPGTPVLTYAPAEPRASLFRPAPAWVGAAARLATPLGPLVAAPLPNETVAFEIHARAAERFNHGTARVRATARALLLELLLHLFAPDPGAPADRGAGANGGSVAGPAGTARLLRIRETLDLIAQMPFSRADSVRERLAALGRSYDHQARLFRGAYGITPLQYVSSRRLERAKNLLRDTDDPVATVARTMGFADVVYFNRFFRKVAGMTPGEYRRGT